MYNRIVLARLVESLGRYAEALHPSIEALREHDQRHGTAYADTLLTYFDAMGDVARAAAMVGVHPNTLRHRLRRARELFGLDLDDPDERLLAWMQLRLLVETGVPRRTVVPDGPSDRKGSPRRRVAY